VIQAVFAGLPVADFDAAIEFYERFFGRPADLVPKDGDSAWQLAEAGWPAPSSPTPRATRSPSRSAARSAARRRANRPSCVAIATPDARFGSRHGVAFAIAIEHTAAAQCPVDEKCM
jgi:catechol 2,3-dioxygenase-like lactoylglutathione lyase family enzyme